MAPSTTRPATSARPAPTPCSARQSPDRGGIGARVVPLGCRNCWLSGSTPAATPSPRRVRTTAIAFTSARFTSLNTVSSPRKPKLAPGRGAVSRWLSSRLLPRDLTRWHLSRYAHAYIFIIQQPPLGIENASFVNQSIEQLDRGMPTAPGPQPPCEPRPTMRADSDGPESAFRVRS